MVAGLDTSGGLTGVRVLHHCELGGYFLISLREFPDQLSGKSILDPVGVGEDIDTVSRATITMEASTSAIRQGVRQLARESSSNKRRTSDRIRHFPNTS